MTKSRNFPHRKYARRMGALSRLDSRLAWILLALDGGMTLEDRQRAIRDKKRIQLEIATLQSRTQKGGNKVSTKKVGANVGWKGLVR